MNIHSKTCTWVYSIIHNGQKVVFIQQITINNRGKSTNTYNSVVEFKKIYAKESARYKRSSDFKNEPLSTFHTLVMFTQRINANLRMMKLPGCKVVKNLPANIGDAGDMGLILGLGKSHEEEMATHSSILAWNISCTKEPGGLQSMGSKRVRHDWAHTHTNLKSIKLLGKTVVTFG